MTLMELYALLRKQCVDAGGQSAWAAQHGISTAYVSDVLNARTDPGPKILAALGMVKVETYERSNRT